MESVYVIVRSAHPQCAAGKSPSLKLTLLKLWQIEVWTGFYSDPVQWCKPPDLRCHTTRDPPPGIVFCDKVNKLCGRPPQYAPAPCDLDLESDVRVTCDVGYLCANFSLPRSLGSRLQCTRQTDVNVRQTDVRQHHRLMPRLLGAGHNKRDGCSLQ